MRRGTGSERGGRERLGEGKGRWGETRTEIYLRMDKDLENGGRG